MTELLGIFGDTISTLKTIIVLMVVIGIVFILFYIKEMRPVILIILGVVVLAGGIGATVQNVKYFNASNKTIGEVINSTLHSTHIVKQDENTFELNVLGFKQSEYDENTYLTEYQMAQVANLDLKNQKYTLKLNDYRCFSNVQNDNDKYMQSKFTYTFLDNNNEEIMTDTLYITFAFYEKSTTILLQTQGGEQAKELWKAFERKNGIKITFDNSTIDEMYFG